MYCTSLCQLCSMCTWPWNIEGAPGRKQNTVEFGAIMTNCLGGPFSTPGKRHSWLGSSVLSFLAILGSEFGAAC